MLLIKVTPKSTIALYLDQDILASANIRPQCDITNHSCTGSCLSDNEYYDSFSEDKINSDSDNNDNGHINVSLLNEGESISFNYSGLSKPFGGNPVPNGHFKVIDGQVMKCSLCDKTYGLTDCSTSLIITILSYIKSIFHVITI